MLRDLWGSRFRATVENFGLQGLRGWGFGQGFFLLGLRVSVP